MTEEQIQDILSSTKYMEAMKKIAAIYPNGFDIKKIDKIIKAKIEELSNKYDSIQKPVQLRKT